MTLVDGVDTQLVVGDHEAFARSLDIITSEVSFDRDVSVSTFEATIRVLGDVRGRGRDDAARICAIVAINGRPALRPKGARGRRRVVEEALRAHGSCWKYDLRQNRKVAEPGHGHWGR